MRILLVDDNALVRRAIRGILRGRNMWEICGEASSGPEACEKARALRPDVILLDKNMPGPSGFETAQLIRQQNSHVKILITSQEDARYLFSTAIRSGADGCIDKARLSSDLISAIQKFDSQGSSPLVARVAVRPA